MTPWLRTVAEWNPISSLVLAVRQLWGNTGPAPDSAALPLQYPVLTTLIWTVGITAVVAPLALRTFRRRTQILSRVLTVGLGDPYLKYHPH